MKFVPHPYQRVAIDHAVSFLRGAPRASRILYAGPTGVGKSVVEAEIQRALDGCWIVSPRDEILEGLVDKGAIAEQVCTPIRLRNMLMKGEVRHPKYLLFDEGHHHSAESWQQVHMLTGFAPAAAFTATPYRGSPRSTAEFLEFWGDPNWIITLAEAAEGGYVSIPEFKMLPLVDDDIVDIGAGGEFTVTSIDGATLDRLSDCADQARPWYDGTRWDRATVFAMPSSACCRRLQKDLADRGLPAFVVNAETAKADRYTAFVAVRERILALLHINIVSEGIDLPFRRLVDLAPTMSPVRWVQQIGREMRPVPPGEPPPEYICTNRNLLRHAYALEGAVPSYAAAAAEAAFPSTQRAHSRVLGLEAIGRFRPTAVKLTSGLTVHVYSLSTAVEGTVVEYCVIVHPTGQPFWASKVNTVVEGKRNYGTWRECDPPKDMRGFASVPPRPLTEKQFGWWNRSAARYGLDSEQAVDRKQFPILPVLADTGMRLQ